MEKIDEWMEELGWRSLGPQKMESMKSYIKGKWRMNFYTTKNSYTVQNATIKFDSGTMRGHVYNKEDLTRALSAL